MRISDWSSDVCSSDLVVIGRELARKFEKALRQLDADRGKLGRHRPFGLALQAKARAHQWRSVKGKKAGGLQHIFVDCFADRSEEHTSELQSLMRISYAVFCLKKKKDNTEIILTNYTYVLYITHILTSNSKIKLI